MENLKDFFKIIKIMFLNFSINLKCVCTCVCMCVCARVCVLITVKIIKIIFFRQDQKFKVNFITPAETDFLFRFHVAYFNA